MYRVINVLVYAQDKEKALDEAHKVVHETLKTTNNGGLFDYYQDFSGKPNEVSVPSDFAEGLAGIIPPALEVSTVRFPVEDPSGLELAMSAFESIRENFKDNMKKIRCHMVLYTDDEIFDESQEYDNFDFEWPKLYDDPGSFMHICKCLFRQDPEDGYLFDFTGASITRPYDLKRILNDTDEDPFYAYASGVEDPYSGHCIWNQPLWVVPFIVPLPNN